MSAEDAPTIRRLREAVRALEDENERLREVLQAEKTDSDAKILMRELGLTLCPARLLARLYRANGEIVEHTTLNATTGYRQTKLDYLSTDVPEFRSNVVWVSGIRKVCPHIKSVRGLGYMLLPEGVAFIRKILNGAQSV